MAKKTETAKNPLILRFHRLLDAFAKSDDERDFYLDRHEGFIFYVDLDKTTEELNHLLNELETNVDRYCLIPKMTFYETKKFMEGFVNEKVYDIDTKEKLLDVIGSKEARENFIEFIYDHLTELEKWQQYYHERSRIRIIEWLREMDIRFVFEEDIDLIKPVVEKLKLHIFDAKVPKDVQQARDALEKKAATYYSNEALNPRPKRGRPPKQAAKVEVDPQLTADIYKTVPSGLRHFLFMPEYSATSATFSAKFDTEAELIASLRGTTRVKVDTKLEALSQRLESLRHLSDRLKDVDDVSFGKDEKLISAVSEQGSAGGDEKPKGKISAIASGFLPKKGTKKDLKEIIAKKKEAGVKSVTQIKKKKRDE
ncbi:MAG: hypothetical protein SP1CHLAM54_12170 [Chlamydiia bacterium]|nr:hypothetical protein [Chlamydiia bacterium]MCH9616115.1 hypothetical protein [Chlamydiia bacterium]MCH9629462.1 hypothetical protein [Chlamydiia bacterium]